MAQVDNTSCNEDFCQRHPLLLEHLDAVLQQNKTMNLTSIKEREAGKVLHIEDSLAVLPEVQAAPTGSMADLGSGAGYPGIPLALVSGRTTTLIEASKKKAAFLEEFVQKHRLTQQIRVIGLRTEELALQEPGSFSVITARAVTALPALLELATPLLAEGGQLIALKGKHDSDEEARGLEAAQKLGMTALNSRSYTLSQDNIERRVLVYKKTGDPTLVLPRRPGMATKRPLA